jgi:hypothetical protein
MNERQVKNTREGQAHSLTSLIPIRRSLVTTVEIKEVLREGDARKMQQMVDVLIDEYGLKGREENYEIPKECNHV